MFYRMKQITHIVAASLLFAAAIAFAIPDMALASPPHQWCYSSAIVHCGPDGFDSKGACKKVQNEDPTLVTEPCHKVPLPS